MRVACVADVHLANHRIGAGDYQVGMNERARMVLKALEQAVDKSMQASAELFIVLGDLFDNATPNPQTLAEAARVLTKMPSMILMGNHERVSDAIGDHALGPLERAGVDAITEPQSYTGTKSKNSLLLVPFRRGNPSEWLPDVLAEIGDISGNDTLLLHMGLRASQATGWQASALGAIDTTALSRMCQERGVKLALAGDWHEHSIYELAGVRMVQVGALVPTGWDNPGLDPYGSLISLDTEDPLGTFKRTVIPGPRFITIHGVLSPETIAATTPPDCQLFIRWIAHSEAMLAEQREAAKLVPAHFHRFELDKELIRGAAQTAAKQARAQGTLEAALVEHCKGLELPEGVELGALIERAKGYLEL